MGIIILYIRICGENYNDNIYPFLGSIFCQNHTHIIICIYYVGPTKNTISDFWQMIWDCKAIVIVMLTKPEEKGRVRNIYI